MAALVIRDASYSGASLHIFVLRVLRHKKIVASNMLVCFGNRFESVYMVSYNVQPPSWKMAEGSV
jgi:hypothetical protein